MLRKAILPVLILTAASLGAQTPPAPANPMSAALLRSFATVSIAVIVAMTWNFLLNNIITYRDQQLRGIAFFRGLASF
jgi:putative flippase GtrA